jgi:hypothetical protein
MSHFLLMAFFLRRKCQLIAMMRGCLIELIDPAETRSISVALIDKCTLFEINLLLWNGRMTRSSIPLPLGGFHRCVPRLRIALEGKDIKIIDENWARLSQLSAEFGYE